MNPRLTWLLYVALITLGSLAVTVGMFFVAYYTGAVFTATLARTPLSLLVLVFGNLLLVRSLPQAGITTLWAGCVVALALSPAFWTGNLLFGRIVTSNPWLIAGLDGSVWLGVSYMSLRLLSRTSH